MQTERQWKIRSSACRCLHYSLRAGPHPRALSRGDCAPRSGRRHFYSYSEREPETELPDALLRLPDVAGECRPAA